MTLNKGTSSVGATAVGEEDVAGVVAAGMFGVASAVAVGVSPPCCRSQIGEC